MEPSTVKYGNIGNKSNNNKVKKATYFYNNNNNNNNNPPDLLEFIININLNKLVNTENFIININFFNCYFDNNG